MRLPAPTRRTPGKATGSLAGIPLGIKDLFATRGVDSTAGSRILAGFKPEYESSVTANLRRAGAGMLGKLNMDEFAMGSSNETSAYGPVLSPWRRKGSNVNLTPGGSSGGSAAAVAARIAPGVTGTDTGGSIRQPAAFTGISGIKPTYGRCSRWGIVSLRKLARPGGADGADVRDCAILLEAMAGFDPKDSTSLDLPVPSGKRDCRAISRVSVSVFPRNIGSTGCPATSTRLWDQGIEWLKDAGAEIVEISLPHTKYALPTYYIIAPAEASSNLARYDGVRYGLRVEGVKTLDDMYAATRADGLRRRGQAPDHDRHLRAVGGLLRRLFHQGAEGAGADQAGFRPRVRAVRRDPDPDRAVGRVRHRRDHRPAGDVSERRVRGSGEPRGTAGDVASRAGSTGRGCRSGLHLIGPSSTSRSCSTRAWRSRSARASPRGPEKWW